MSDAMNCPNCGQFFSKKGGPRQHPHIQDVQYCTPCYERFEKWGFFAAPPTPAETPARSEPAPDVRVAAERVLKQPPNFYIEEDIGLQIARYFRDADTIARHILATPPAVEPKYQPTPMPWRPAPRTDTQALIEEARAVPEGHVGYGRALINRLADALTSAETAKRDGINAGVIAQLEKLPHADGEPILPVSLAVWHLVKRKKQADNELNAARALVEKLRATEKQTSDAYQRIRQKLGAFETPPVSLYGPPAEHVYADTEAAIDQLRAERDAARENTKLAARLGLGNNKLAELLHAELIALRAAIRTLAPDATDDELVAAVERAGKELRALGPVERECRKDSGWGPPYTDTRELKRVGFEVRQIRVLHTSAGEGVAG